MSNNTLAIIKPPHSLEGYVIGYVIQSAAERGLRPTRLWLGSPSEAQWEEFYSDHRGKDFFPGLIKHMASGPSIFLILTNSHTNQDAIKAWRTAMGPIREEYSKGGPINVVHGSDSRASYEKESKLVFGVVP